MVVSSVGISELPAIGSCLTLRSLPVNAAEVGSTLAGFRLGFSINRFSMTAPTESVVGMLFVGPGRLSDPSFGLLHLSIVFPTSSFPMAGKLERI